MNFRDTYKYKIELHAHTSPASPCGDLLPEAVVDAYAECGYDGIVITNHFSDLLMRSSDPQEACEIYLRDYYKAKEQGFKRGIRVYLGLEARFPENDNDYLIYGVDEEQVAKAHSLMRDDYISFYKSFKSNRNVIIQAHPFRDGMERQKPEFLDGVEVFNLHPNHNSRISIAARYAAEHPHFIKTVGSDFHHPGQHALGAILTKTLPEDSFGLAEIILSRDFCMDISGNIIIP